MTTLLIDADTIAYTAALSSEFKHEWPNGAVTVEANVEESFEYFQKAIEGLKETFETGRVKIALTGLTNFRKTVLPSYKANRGTKPVCLQQLKELAVERMGAVIKPLIEADDTVGIWATHPTLIKDEKIVVSIDKDLRTIPGTLSRGDGMLFKISMSEANYYFLRQVLTGDSTDQYKGCPGIGPVKADTILGPFMVQGKFAARDAWDAVVAAYEKSGLTASDALVQARVARILRAKDYNFKTKEPILWTPPSTP